jgi:hypothetical protein
MPPSWLSFLSLQSSTHPQLEDPNIRSVSELPKERIANSKVLRNAKSAFLTGSKQENLKCIVPK